LLDLADKAANVDGKPSGYYNQVLINKFAEGKGIGRHTDREGIYINENGMVGSVAVYSIGNTKTKHTFNDYPVQVNSRSLGIMGTGSLYHSVGEAAAGGRYSITFRHIPPKEAASVIVSKGRVVGAVPVLV
jgi:hypothetical protein